MIVTTYSEEETELFGRQLSVGLKPNTVICFQGELGAGKTTLIRGIASELSGIDPMQVTSPTFTYLNIYEGRIAVCHFDLYRLNHAEEFILMGFDEYFYAGGVCCVEWSEKIEQLIPEEAVRIRMLHGGSVRKIIVANYEKDQI